MEKTSYKFVEPNEFTYNPARINVGSIAFNNMNKTVIVSSLYVVVRMSEALNNEFIFQYLKSPIFIKEVRRNTEGSVREYLFYENFSNIKLPYTKNTNEQNKIGTFFKSLDDAITLHLAAIQRQQDLKKAMLQKLFPINGETIPTVRFASFSEEWQQRKLSDVSNYRNGKAHEKDISKDGKYIVINSKFVSTVGKIKKYSDNLIEPMSTGEIAFVLSDVPNGRAIARTFLVTEDEKFSLNQRIAGITPFKETDSYYLYILMNRNPYFLKFDNGVGQTNLSKAEVENFEALYPSYSEQQKIGAFFKSLDETLALHQQVLEKLKLLKKSLLQKMFI